MNTNAPNFFYPVRVSWFNRVRKYKSHPSYVRMKQNYKWNAIWKYIHALVFCIKINGQHIISSFLLLLACCLGSSMVSLPHRWYPLVKRCRQPSQPPHPAPTAPVLCRNPRELEERNEAPRPQSKKEHKRKKKRIRILVVAAAAMPTRKHSPLMLMQSLLRACWMRQT